MGIGRASQACKVRRASDGSACVCVCLCAVSHPDGAVNDATDALLCTHTHVCTHMHAQTSLPSVCSLVPVYGIPLHVCQRPARSNHNVALHDIKQTQHTCVMDANSARTLVTIPRSSLSRKYVVHHSRRSAILHATYVKHRHTHKAMHACRPGHYCAHKHLHARTDANTVLHA